MGSALSATGGSWDEDDDLRPEEFEELEQKTGFTREELRKLYRRFKILDRSGMGTLGKDDLLRVPEVVMNPLVDRVVGYFGFGPYAQELSPKRQANTRINFPDFVSTLSLFTRANLTREEKLENVFPAFTLHNSSNNTGEAAAAAGDKLLDRNQFISLLQELVGKYMAQEDIEELAGFALEDHPDGLTFEQFAALLPQSDAEQRESEQLKQDAAEAFHRRRERKLIQGGKN